MVAIPCFRSLQLCCACRSEKLASISLDAGKSVGVHVWTLTPSKRPGLDAKALALVPQEHGHGGPSIMERFKRMAPPSFKGESQPLLVESWMREIEKIFRAIRCVEEDKVTLATYMLQERADVWWSSLLHTRFEDSAVEESEMEQYLEENKASQERSAPPFQWHDRKKVTYQSPQRPVAAIS
ncbi:hypothetical protein Taro_050143 [Colocasia esculenta]|uniref:Retrotransposon gag domain-containing protein n=1 Tax=Colocasia esculenta TaxID=4460 RepID=A0A843XCY7_COLES|nr:hypothetical protein [Colocasia esculenta]